MTEKHFSTPDLHHNLPAYRLLLLWLISSACFLVVVLHYKTYANAVNGFGDSIDYMRAANAIARWNFTGVHVMQFWGVSYCSALISKITALPIMPSLIIVSALSSFIACFLAARLWGWWVAAFFIVLNFDWMQRSWLGGAEPTFMALLLTAFLFARSDKWEWAALLASLATVVRPLGVCALVAIGIVLLLRKDYWVFARTLVIGLAIGLLYTIPFRLYMHDAFANVHDYQGSHSVFGVPFVAMVQGMFLHQPWTNLILCSAWIIFILLGIVLYLISDSCAQERKARPVEFIFAGLYTLMTCSYNYPQWVFGGFARFAIPVIPFALLGLQQVLPKQEKFIWASAVVFPLLAGASAIGIRNILR
jgi:hypothetical protein